MQFMVFFSLSKPRGPTKYSAFLFKSASTTDFLLPHLSSISQSLSVNISAALSSVPTSVTLATFPQISHDILMAPELTFGNHIHQTSYAFKCSLYLVAC